MFDIKFITDYNSSPLENLFDYTFYNKKIGVLKSSYNQFQKQLTTKIRSKKKLIRYIEIEPQSISRVFQDNIIYNKSKITVIKKEVINLINLIIENNNNYDLSIISLFKNFRNHNITNSVSYKYNIGRKSLELELNLILTKRLSKFKNIIFINPSEFLFNTDNYQTEKQWYNTKSSYSLSEFKTLSSKIYTIIEEFYSNKKKLIICDLDNTLWGGTVGDDGIENIVLGGHNPKGEAFLDLQKYLLDLKKKGIVLSICSKNEHATASSAISKHPEMILRLKDFVSVKINWKDKAENIKSILSELNLNQDDAIFFDDSASERARVKSVFPKMLIPELPENNILYPKILRDMNCFNFDLTNEDKKRTLLYKQNTKREKDKKNYIKSNSYENWLSTLNLKVHFFDLNKINLNRTLQLLNKTNQMNLTTRRYTVKDIDPLLKDKNTFLYVVKVEDKYGDYGLVGLVFIKKESSTIIITDYILSCRVFGKFIEQSMIEFIHLICQKNKIKKLLAKYIKTKKNKPCLDFLNTTNYFTRKNNLFTWHVNKKLNFPKFIKIFYKNKIINL